VLGCLIAGSITLADALTRQSALDDTGQRAVALSVDAAELYHSLADADAMATSGYVAGGVEPAAVRARYDRDLAGAADTLARAAGELGQDAPEHRWVTTVAAQLPMYSGMIETARFYNRQGLPLGQTYLTTASALLRDTVLPAVDRLRDPGQARLLAGDGEAVGPARFAVLLVGVPLLVLLVGVSVRERHRTNRVLNPGLVVAGVLLAVALGWWAVATTVAGIKLGEAARQSTAMTALDDARAAVLRARSNESLVLVARSGGKASDDGFTAQLTRVIGADDRGGLLALASPEVRPDGLGRSPLVDAVRAETRHYAGAHRALRAADDGGDYRAAVASATGADPDGSGAAFERLDDALRRAIAAPRAALSADVEAARTALGGLAGGPAVLTLLAAVAAAVGIAVRVREYS
jgi:hypothetical protein